MIATEKTGRAREFVSSGVILRYGGAGICVPETGRNAGENGLSGRNSGKKCTGFGLRAFFLGKIEKISILHDFSSIFLAILLTRHLLSYKISNA